MFVDLPLIALHGYATVVLHESAHCAGEQNRYWEMHNAIFASYETLSMIDASDEKAVREAAIDLAQTIGADEAQMRECVESQKYRPIVLSIAQDAQSRGVDVTPTILVGSEPVQGAVAFDELKLVIDKELAKAADGAAAGPTSPPATLGP